MRSTPATCRAPRRPGPDAGNVPRASPPRAATFWMPGQSEDQTQGADQDTAARKRLPALGAEERRCRFHGGLSTGPKTIEGKARIAAAQRRRWARRRGEDIRTERLRAISPI